MTTRAAPLGAVLFVGLCMAAPVATNGQEIPPPVPAPVPEASADSTTPAADGGVSPKGAFIRAALLPGWGHASIGSYNRGAFYFAAELTTAWGFMRTRMRVNEARNRAAFREAVIRAEKEALGMEPEDIDAAVESDEIVTELNGLASAREDEREDWAALGIFFVFLAGADAFVSAHLKDFPTPITLDAAPLPGGRVELSVGLKLPN